MRSVRLLGQEWSIADGGKFECCGAKGRVKEELDTFGVSGWCTRTQVEAANSKEIINSKCDCN